jgi:polyisoprenoid-binding protein YceI
MLPLAAAMLHPAAAAPRDIALTPQSAEIGFRAYALGLFPVDGVFHRFSGTLTLDPELAACTVTVTVETASLSMDDRAVEQAVLGPGLLDAAAFPAMTYRGECAADGKSIAGTLTMHGVIRPLALQVQRDGSKYVAQSALRRADWGVRGQPVLAGPTIRIKVSTTVPLP